MQRRARQVRRPHNTRFLSLFCAVREGPPRANGGSANPPKVSCEARMRVAKLLAEESPKLPPWLVANAGDVNALRIRFLENPVRVVGELRKPHLPIAALHHV